jgi:hypothetical protein
MAEEHPAARYDTEVREVRRQSMNAMFALGLVVVARVSHIAALHWRIALLRDAEAGASPEAAMLELSEKIVRYDVIVELLVLILTSALFLGWLYRVVRLTRALGGNALKWSPKEAVWAFIIPVISFLRPYRVLRDVHDELVPEFVPEPPLEVRPQEGGYRQVEFRAPPPPMKLHHASIGGFWGTFWFGKALSVLARVDRGDGVDTLLTRAALSTVAEGIEILSVVLAVMMIRTVTARLLERFRRIRWSSIETLEDEGVTVL